MGWDIAIGMIVVILFVVWAILELDFWAAVGASLVRLVKRIPSLVRRLTGRQREVR